MEAPDPLKALAAEVLRVLDLQRKYFRWRETSVLEQSRKAEAELRRRCLAALNPPARGLFSESTP